MHEHFLILGFETNPILLSLVVSMVLIPLDYWFANTVNSSIMLLDLLGAAAQAQPCNSDTLWPSLARGPRENCTPYGSLLSVRYCTSVLLCGALRCGQCRFLMVAFISKYDATCHYMIETSAISVKASGTACHLSSCHLHRCRYSSWHWRQSALRLIYSTAALTTDINSLSHQTCTMIVLLRVLDFPRNNMPR